MNRQQLVRRARSNGHFDTGRTLWVFCPVCRKKVEVDKVAGRTVVQQLDAAVRHHLDGYCERN